MLRLWIGFYKVVLALKEAKGSLRNGAGIGATGSYRAGSNGKHPQWSRNRNNNHQILSRKARISKSKLCLGNYDYPKQDSNLSNSSRRLFGACLGGPWMVFEDAFGTSWRHSETFLGGFCNYVTSILVSSCQLYWVN